MRRARRGRSGEGDEQGMGAEGGRLELRMELAGHEPGVIGQLDHLDEAAVRRRARKDEAGVFSEVSSNQRARSGGPSRTRTWDQAIMSPEPGSIYKEDKKGQKRTKSRSSKHLGTTNKRKAKRSVGHEGT